MSVIINLLLLSIAILIVAQIMPSIHIKNVWTVIVVAIVYSLINFFVGWLLVLLTLPLVIITFGLFKFVINAFLLWITDKLIEDFKIDNISSTFLAAFLITIIDSALKWLV